MTQPKKLRRIGVWNLILPLPMYFVTSCWGLFNLSLMPEALSGASQPAWVLYWLLLPLAVSPIMGVYGVVYGCRHRADASGAGCAVRSAVSLVINGLLFWAACYVGSIA